MKNYVHTCVCHCVHQCGSFIVCVSVGVCVSLCERRCVSLYVCHCVYVSFILVKLRFTHLDDIWPTYNDTYDNGLHINKITRVITHAQWRTHNDIHNDTQWHTLTQLTLTRTKLTTKHKDTYMLTHICWHTLVHIHKHTNTRTDTYGHIHEHKRTYKNIHTITQDYIKTRTQCLI